MGSVTPINKHWSGADALAAALGEIAENDSVVVVTRSDEIGSISVWFGGNKLTNEQALYMAHAIVKEIDNQDG